MVSFNIIKRVLAVHFTCTKAEINWLNQNQQSEMKCYTALIVKQSQPSIIIYIKDTHFLVYPSPYHHNYGGIWVLHSLTCVWCSWYPRDAVPVVWIHSILRVWWGSVCVYMCRNVYTRREESHWTGVSVARPQLQKPPISRDTQAGWQTSKTTQWQVHVFLF